MANQEALDLSRNTGIGINDINAPGQIEQIFVQKHLRDSFAFRLAGPGLQGHDFGIAVPSVRVGAVNSSLELRAIQSVDQVGIEVYFDFLKAGTPSYLWT